MEASPRSDCFVEEVGRKDVELFGGSGLYLVYDGFVLFLLFASEAAAAEAATQDKEPLLSMSLSLSPSLYSLIICCCHQSWLRERSLMVTPASPAAVPQ